MPIPLLLAGMLPNIQKYAIIGLVVVLALVGVYIKGRTDGAEKVELQYQKEKLEWQQSVSISQGIMDDVMKNIIKDYTIKNTEYKTIVKYIEKQPEVITQYIPVEYDRKCEIPVGFVDLHNKAAEGLTFDKLKDIPTNYGVPSDKKLSDVAKTVTINYTEYNNLVEQTKSLQAVIREFQEKQEALTK